MRRAIAFGSRRRAASESSRLANVLVGEVRQIVTGGLRPAMVLVSQSCKYLVLGVVEAGNMQFGAIL